MTIRTRKHLQKNLKTQIVNLYLSGKKKSDILREYDLHSITLDRWIKQNQSSGLFKEDHNRTPEEKEIIELRKRNQRLEMENDILEQTALIMGRKYK